MTDVTAPVIVPLLVLTELTSEVERWREACFEAEVELNHALDRERQLRGDLAFADAAAATDKGGAVRIVDELCAERDALTEALEQERRFKAGWVDSALFQQARANELEAELVRVAVERDAAYDEITSLENQLGESQDTVVENHELIRTLQEELTSERGKLFRIGRIVDGSYEPERMLLEIRRALGIA